jgi:60S ribosome subunit biogenesis protein NIP7
MRPLTEDETKTFFGTLAKFLGSNIKFLIDREDGEYVFRLHKDRVYYINSEVLKMASHIGKEELIGAGTCFGKFTKTGKMKLHITCLDYLAKYAKFKVWVKPNGEQTFLYGNHVLKGHLARITENTPSNIGVVIFSITDIPLGFGVCMKTTSQCRDLDPTQVVVINQADVGEYLRSEEEI